VRIVSEGEEVSKLTPKMKLSKKQGMNSKSSYSNLVHTPLLKTCPCRDKLLLLTSHSDKNPDKQFLRYPNWMVCYYNWFPCLGFVSILFGYGQCVSFLNQLLQKDATCCYFKWLDEVVDEV